MNFTEMLQTDVPQGRNGKHKEIVTKILSDLDQVQKGMAIKVPLERLAESKRKSTVSVESCDSEKRSHCCDRQR